MSGFLVEKQSLVRQVSFSILEHLPFTQPTMCRLFGIWTRVFCLEGVPHSRLGEGLGELQGGQVGWGQLHEGGECVTTTLMTIIGLNFWTRAESEFWKFMIEYLGKFGNDF